MTKRNIIISGAVLVALGFGACWLLPKIQAAKKGSDMLAVAVVPFQIRDGWGYKVVVDGHTYIYQDVIPDIPGNKVFRTRENALRVGNVVMQKLTHHKISSISQQEMVDMQIAEAE